MTLIYEYEISLPNGNLAHDAFLEACQTAFVDYAVATEGECFARFTTPRSILESRNPFTVTLRDGKVYFVDHFAASGKEYHLDARGNLDGEPSPLDHMPGILANAWSFVRRLPAFARGATTSMASRAGRPNILLEEDSAAFYFGDVLVLSAERSDADFLADDPLRGELARLIDRPTEDLRRPLRIRQYELLTAKGSVLVEDHEVAIDLAERLTKIHRLIIEKEGRDKAATL